jgi:hypothetical protein
MDFSFSFPVASLPLSLAAAAEPLLRASKKAPPAAVGESAAKIWHIRQPHDHPARTSRCDAPGSGRVTVIVIITRAAAA